MKKSNIILIVLGLVVFALLYIPLLPKATHILGDVGNNLPLPSGATVLDTGVLCTNSSTLLLASSTQSRPWIELSNTGSSPVWLGYGFSASAYKGTLLASSTTMTLNQVSTYQGAIYCITNGASATTSISGVN